MPDPTPDTPSAEIVVRPAMPEDAGGYLRLVEALAGFEKLPPPDAEAKTRLVAHLFGDRPLYRLLVAEDRTRSTIVGYAAHFLAYSTFRAQPTFYLEDLFVLPEYRSAKVGHRLMVSCARTAVAEGCGRMDFLVLDWNELALEFYSRHGVKTHREWILHRLQGNDLESFAAMDGNKTE